MNFVSIYRQWRALQSWERSTFVRAVVFLPVMVFALHFLRLTSISRWASAETTNLATRTANPMQPERCAQIVAYVATRVIGDGSCLPQALLLCRLLRSCGWPARLRLGARTSERKFEAHAWVELNGAALGPGSKDFVAFDRFDDERGNLGSEVRS